MTFLVMAPMVYSNDYAHEAKALFDRMIDANRRLDYQGIFTYEHAGVLRSLRILHLSRDDHQYQSLLYLNGPRKEIVERGVPLSCEISGNSVFGQMRTADSDSLEDFYQFILMPEEDRVAGRKVRVIQVVPRDEMRYGFILSIDEETGLLLQSLLIGTNRRAMERFHFVDLNLEPDAAEVAGLIGDTTPQKKCTPTEEVAEWRAGWLPPGFGMVTQSSGESGGAVMSYSDGLSFVSVFVDPEGESRFPDIQAQRGATVAQVSTVAKDGQAFTVCVVGEIPGEVAGRIARFIAPANDGNP